MIIVIKNSHMALTIRYNGFIIFCHILWGVKLYSVWCAGNNPRISPILISIENRWDVLGGFPKGKEVLLCTDNPLNIVHLLSTSPPGRSVSKRWQKAKVVSRCPTSNYRSVLLFSSCSTVLMGCPDLWSQTCFSPHCLAGLAKPMGLVEGPGGLGEGGAAATLGVDSRESEGRYEEYGYNAQLSDRISLDRNIPDYRPKKWVCCSAFKQRTCPWRWDKNRHWAAVC